MTDQSAPDCTCRDIAQVLADALAGHPTECAAHSVAPQLADRAQRFALNDNAAIRAAIVNAHTTIEGA